MSLQRTQGVLSAFLLILFALLLLVAYRNLAVPPAAIPPDGHDASLILETGTSIRMTDAESAELFRAVASFHDRLNDPQVHSTVSGEACMACHADIVDRESVNRKMPGENGALIVTQETNHHRVHRDSDVVTISDSCTYCHREFQIAYDADQVTISSYVEKTTCAACHSRFAPRRLMEESLKDESKDPEDPSCTCHCCHFGWIQQHDLKEISERFVETLRIGSEAEDCLACHGENPLIMPRHLQDRYWQNE